MIVANPNPPDNPNSLNSAADQEEVLKAHGALLSIVDMLMSSVQDAVAAGATFNQFELSTREMLRQTGERMLTLFVRSQGDGDLGATVTTDEGETLKRSAAPRDAVALNSLIVANTFRQFTYSAGKHKAIVLRPASARLELPGEQWSFLLQEFAQTPAVDQSYELATRNLRCILGGKFSVATAEQLNCHMGAAAGEFLAEPPSPEPANEATLLVASADCKGVPLVKADAAKVAAFATSKKNPGNRRMATVASVYSVEPHVRTAEEIVAGLFREEPEAEAVVARPRPKNKITVSVHLHHRPPGRRGAESGCSFGRDAFVPVRTHNGGRCHGESRARAEVERVGGAIG